MQVMAVLGTRHNNGERDIAPGANATDSADRTTEDLSFTATR